MEGYDPTPAIVRDYDRDKDGDAKPPKVNGRPDCSRSDKIMSQPYDGVSFRRGWGDTGYRVQVVKHDCPADHCGFDRMIRRIDVNAERRDEVRYYCLNPNCVHYVADALSYACSGSYPSRQTDEPAVFERVADD
jgi:hypothetical protein